MLLTLSVSMPGARDLGHLLRKHPDRVSRIQVTAGTAWVFFPQAGHQTCTAALLVEPDPAARRPGRGVTHTLLRDHISDRDWTSGSLMAGAVKQAFRSAMAGRSQTHPDLAAAALPLTIELPVAPLDGPSDLAQRLFGPLGWDVAAHPIPMDEAVPRWGDAPLAALRLTGTLRLSDALNQLYVLLPVLHDRRHHWVDDSAVDTLLRAGGSWLAGHPERTLITSRALAHQRRLAADAIAQLSESDGLATDPDEELVPATSPATGTAVPAADPDPAAAGSGEQTRAASRPNLATARRDAVMSELTALRPASVVDIGCGEGRLLADLLAHPAGITRLLGVDVSARALLRARAALRLEQRPERAPVTVELAQSSVVYRDPALSGFDAAVVMEVIEHLDPDRLGALQDSIFAAAAPQSVLVTTPNAEHNALYPGLAAGAFRHPDHRFEFSRAEFAQWCDDVAGRNGYRVRISSVGPDDPTHGGPTQLAVFTR